MPFDWGEFLKLACDLQGRSGPGYSEEAAYRTAVSRAYYAAFCRTRDYAQANLRFRPSRTARDHQQLIDHLRLQAHPWGDIADDLDDLRGWRNQCDYDPYVPNLQNMVTRAIQIANQILQHTGGIV